MAAVNEIDLEATASRALTSPAVTNRVAAAAGGVSATSIEHMAHQSIGKLRLKPG